MSNSLQSQLLRDADLCVKCGLCLPHCPTYRLMQQEGDSPRGRIALLQGLASRQIPFTVTTETHLDGCVACGACESVCPAHVPYSRLYGNGRDFLMTLRPPRHRAARLIDVFFASVWLRRSRFVLLWIYIRSGAQGLRHRYDAHRRRWRIN